MKKKKKKRLYFQGQSLNPCQQLYYDLCQRLLLLPADNYMANLLFLFDAAFNIKAPATL